MAAGVLYRFCLHEGLIPAPPVNRRLVWVAVALVLVSIPFTNFRIYEAVPGFQALRDAAKPLWVKTELGILRYVHFLALAYIAQGSWPQWRAPACRRAHHRPGAGGTAQVGQQSLSVFLASLPIAQATAILRDMAGGRDSWLLQAVSNLAGLAAIVAAAYLAAWFKSQPWRKAPQPAASPSGQAACKDPVRQTGRSCLRTACGACENTGCPAARGLMQASHQAQKGAASPAAPFHVCQLVMIVSEQTAWSDRAHRHWR
ncbi:OpgC domain-containing protein [Pannonibacter sp. Pt2-lr]